MMIGMFLVWDVTKCVARPSDIDKWADVSNYDRRSEDELNVIETEPSGLYGGKVTGKADWKAVHRLAEIVRLGKKLEQVQRNEADKIAAKALPVRSPISNPSPPIIGAESIIDQLHEHTGEKLPIYHSALDGWIF